MGRTLDPNGNKPGAQPSFKPESQGYRSYRPGEFQREPLEATAPVARPTPLPKRPKGRFFVGFILMAVCGGGSYQVWNSFFRYEAYGVVTGRVVKISPPWDGVVRSLFVREGEWVRQGEILMNVENPELEDRLSLLSDQLRIAEASLEAEISKLKWDSHWHKDRYQSAVAEYFELWGNLLKEQANLAAIQKSLQRARGLQEQKAVSQSEVDQLEFTRQGTEQKVAKLQTALSELKKRVDITKELVRPGSEQLKPKLVRIETLQSELARVRKMLDQGQVRAPVDGQVLKRHHFAGEYARVAEPVYSVLEEGSLQVVLYMDQRSSKELSVGDGVDLVVQPHAQLMPFDVVRLGDQYEPAPPSIENYYRRNEKLLPVYLEPSDGFDQMTALRPNSVVSLPCTYRWFPVWRGGVR